jgi:hypothetical protein
MRINIRARGRYVPLAQKSKIRGLFMPLRTKEQNIFDWSYPDGSLHPYDIVKKSCKTLINKVLQPRHFHLNWCWTKYQR